MTAMFLLLQIFQCGTIESLFDWVLNQADSSVKGKTDYSNQSESFNQE